MAESRAGYGAVLVAMAVAKAEAEMVVARAVAWAAAPVVPEGKEVGSAAARVVAARVVDMEGAQAGQVG